MSRVGSGVLQKLQLQDIVSGSSGAPKQMGSDPRLLQRFESTHHKLTQVTHGSAEPVGRAKVVKGGD